MVILIMRPIKYPNLAYRYSSPLKMLKYRQYGISAEVFRDIWEEIESKAVKHNEIYSLNKKKHAIWLSEYRKSLIIKISIKIKAFWPFKFFLKMSTMTTPHEINEIELEMTITYSILNNYNNLQVFEILQKQRYSRNHIRKNKINQYK